MDITILTIISIISGLAISWLNIFINSKATAKKDIQESYATESNQNVIIARIDEKLGFIQNDVKDIKAENKILKEDFSKFKTDISADMSILKTNVEKAHERIDKLKGGKE